MATSVMWFRRDLRLDDNPALLAAAAEGAGSGVVPLVVLDPALLGSSAIRTARLHRSLTALQARLDGRLVVRSGAPHEVLPQVVAQAGAASVHIARETTPYGRRRDRRVRDALRDMGVGLIETGTPYAVGPGRVVTGSGSGYQVFTPFLRAWLAHGWPAPAGAARGIRWRGLPSEALPSEALPSEALTSELRPAPPPHEPAHPGAPADDAGEPAALARWHGFLHERLAGYAADRDRPDLDSTSRLSIPLKWGEIHPRRLLADLAAADAPAPDKERFVAELAWREFYADLLWRHPGSAWRDHRDRLRGLRYDDPTTDPVVAQRVEAWRAGRTGYPFVDAGMRQLRALAWMHNRVRMVTASFLTKDLHIWWPHGARHFLELLADGDLASNNHGWQWVAGTGTDAAPYFRIFNPVEQGKRWDPAGDYVRRWVPELAALPGAAAHEPWRHGGAPGYPAPIVEHAAERREALARLADAGPRNC